jgi:hypothetical protein
MTVLRRRLRSPSKLLTTREGLSLVIGGARGHGCALLAKARMRLREGDVPEFHIGIPPDAQLTPLGVDRDEQIAIFSVALVGDPDDDFASRKRLRDLIRRVIFMDQ